MIRMLLAFVLLVPLSARADAPPFALADGDRVVFLGSTIVERDAEHGYFETLLHARFPKANFTFRNLGWSGDTVWGDARAEFGTQKDGYARLVKDTLDAQPTVLLICYGTNESFEGDAGVKPFIDQYNALLTDLSKSGARVWLISPNRLENLPRPLPDPTAHNQQVAAYTAAIKSLAAQRNVGFVDLFNALPDGTTEKPARPLTDNGLHFTRYGGYRFATAVINALLPGSSAQVSTSEQEQSLEKIRQLTIAKNREHFYRWRPQNDTYIFGFRKHEQGRNAVEIPMFDPIVSKLESDITQAAKGLTGTPTFSAPTQD